MDKKTILYQPDTNSNTIFDTAIAYLNKKYDLRFNKIALELEIRLRDTNTLWKDLNMNSLLIELIQSGININMGKLEILAKSDLITTYDPFKEYFTSLPEWDNFDHIGKLCSYITTNDDKLFKYHFEKWLTRAVICALEEGKINKQCLVLFNTIQNSGKSTFLQFIISKLLKRYYTEELSVDKDGLIMLCKSLIINLEYFPAC